MCVFSFHVWGSFHMYMVWMFWLRSSLHHTEEWCVAFLSVSQRGHECSHWQQNQSSLPGAASRCAGQLLSVPPLTSQARHRKLTEQTTTLTSQSRRGLCLLLAFNRISIKRRLGFIFGNYRHVFHTSLFIFRVIFFYSPVFSPPFL